VRCFLRGTDWIIKYYSDELWLQWVKRNAATRWINNITDDETHFITIIAVTITAVRINQMIETNQKTWLAATKS
jgi:hypothetical protein